MKGKCLCGQVEFEVTGHISNIYQCSCSICRKASGTAKTSSLITGVDGVRWIRGKERITSYSRDDGYTTNFCSHCGSPMPNKMSIGEYMCIPVGSLEGEIDRKVVAQIFVESKASWDTVPEAGEVLAGGLGDINEFMKLLHNNC